MSNRGGSGSFVKREYTIELNKAPHYEDTFVGSYSDCVASGSVYYNNGWRVKYSAGPSGNPWTMFATIDVEVNGNNLPYTGSSPTGSTSIQTNWSWHSEYAQKDLLQVGVKGLNNGFGSWINDITTKDKATLDYYFANPPTTSSLTGTTITLPMNWSTTNASSSFLGSSTTSVSASMVVWAMAKNGVKTLPIQSPVLRMTKVVPVGYDLTYYTNGCDRIYSAASVANLFSVPNNFYACMPQDSDPASGTVTTDAGANIPLIYGYKKETPAIDQNGTSITIQLNFVYGLWYQNVFGTRI